MAVDALALPASTTARRVLFIQATEPAAYPPLIHASRLMAEAGWDVTFLSAPTTHFDLELPPHPRIAVRETTPRPSHVMTKPAYAKYLAAAARLALRLRPHIVYVSDPLGAAPGLLAAHLARARLVYHEHDTPAPGTLRPVLARARAAAARRAALVVYPNAARARIAQAELAFSPDRLRIVWNLPRRAEVPTLAVPHGGPLLLYYHGNVSPVLLPQAAVNAVLRLAGKARLRIVGYEAPGAAGYIQHLLAMGGGVGNGPIVEYGGEISRAALIEAATGAQVGLALMPHDEGDVNLSHMAGASNKPFDYMAAGLALLVSDLPDWREMFVAPGYARACDPADPASIAAALGWYLDNPGGRRAMAARGRARIESEWNYDNAFAPVMAALCQQ